MKQNWIFDLGLFPKSCEVAIITRGDSPFLWPEGTKKGRELARSLSKGCYHCLPRLHFLTQIILFDATESGNILQYYIFF